MNSAETQDPSLASIRTFAREAHRDSPPSHDFGHIERVLACAAHIAEAEGADRFIVAAAALLHDIGRGTEARIGPEPDRHEEISAQLAAPFLRSLKIDETRIEKIVEAILCHRHRKNRASASLEAACLYDADKLDSLGAVGVARAYLWLGECGRSLYYPPSDWEHVDPENNSPDVDSFQREWEIKLCRLKDRMRTATGTKLARIRHERMKRILDEIEREVLGN